MIEKANSRIFRARRGRGIMFLKLFLSQNILPGVF